MHLHTHTYTYLSMYVGMFVQRISVKLLGISVVEAREEKGALVGGQTATGVRISKHA